MNLRDLKYLIAVAETRHFGKAAERCFVSQPTLSGQIKKLEDELGVMLFERTNRSVEITPTGEEILAHARLIIEQADLIHRLAESHHDPMAGALRIGAIPTISPYLMPLILAPLKRQYPQLRLVLSEEMTEILLQRLRNHEIDAAFLATPVSGQDLQAIPLYDEPFWLAHPSQHDFSHKQTITSHDLDTTDLLLLSEGHCLADQAMEVCHMKERSQQGELADLRAASLETLIQLVGAGFGSTLIPALAIKGSWSNDKNIVIRPLSVSDAYRRVSLVFRSTYPRTQALETLVQIVLSQLPDTVTPLG